MRTHLHVLAAVSLAYTAVGWLALQVTIPPGYVSLVYPSAGIALSVVLIYGVRVWPAIFIGALLTNTLSGLQADALTPLVALGASVGATLQAILGAFLARRFIHFPSPLDAPRDIVLFLFVIAPASCLLNASLAVPLMHYSGVIAAQEMAFHWWNWWLGDTLGVLLATPLVFAFFGKPREVWRPRRLGITMPLLLVTLLTSAAFVTLRDAEVLRIESQFVRDADEATSRLEQRFTNQIDALRALERFFSLHDATSADEFRHFVAPLIERHNGTQNFTWNPYVDHEDRARFEATARAPDNTPFVILDRIPEDSGVLQPASPRAYYFPILYVEPEISNRRVIGLDPTPIDGPAPAIARTLQTTAPTASESFTLTQETGTQRGVVIYQAVHAPDAPLDAAAPPGLRGLVSSAFRMDDLVNATLPDLAERHLALCLVDISAATDNRRLSGARGCDTADHATSRLNHHATLHFAGREWEARITASGSYARQMRSLVAWTSVATGVFIAGVLGAFLLMTTGHARRTATLVDQRTRELSAASDALGRAQRLAGMGSWEFDPNSGQVRCSDSLRALLELPPDEYFDVRELIQAVTHAERDALSLALGQLGRSTGKMEFDCRPAHNARRTLHLVVEGQSGEAPEAPHRVIGTAQDVTSTRRAASEIERLAHYDALTGLPNRSLWSVRAEAALSGARRHGDVLAVLFLDLDQFKTVNDSLGHRAGDALLCAVAQRLRHCVRNEDVVARLGGDEFVALLPRLAHHGDAAIVAEKMIGAIARPIELEGHQLQVSVSIGIAFHPDDGNDVDTLLKHADIAMYSAKALGRNTWQQFTATMTGRALERLQIESGLRRAIVHHELELHYQPQIDARANTLAGVEALLRWTHPELGAVPPERFIPVAEDSGFIVPLGDWVLENACRQQVAWRTQGRSAIPIAVNVSALQFKRNDFVERVRGILTRTGADASCIELEITESALMSPSGDVLERLQQLRALGLTLALDDFGTGYSSLAYLRRLPISRIKLDRSFVSDLPGDVEDAAVAAAAISMARDLGLDIIAEGVESVPQRNYLLERGCVLMQGYLFAPALPLARFERDYPASGTPATPPQRG